MEQDTAVLASKLLQRESKEIIAITGNDDLVEHYELVAGSRMSVDGLARHIQKRYR